MIKKLDNKGKGQVKGQAIKRVKGRVKTKGQIIG